MMLKVINNGECLKSDDRHEYGGVDLVQRAMFDHLMPGGECDLWYEDVLVALARAHGWMVQITNF